jgi:lipopolysaccharide transport system permease protein
MSTTISNRASAPDPITAENQAATAAAPLHGSSSFTLPEKPLVVIHPTKSWGGAKLGELWASRELLYLLTARDLKIRYKQTLLGAAWVVVQPLLMTVIFTVFLGMIVRVPSGGLPYPLLVFSGLIPWTFFSTAVNGCSASLIGNANLITKVYFPRVLLPASSIAGRLIDFSISFAMLIGIIVYFVVARGYHPVLTWNILAIPFLVGLMTLLAFGLGMLISALNVRYRDVGMAAPVLIQLWMFVSPVLYTTIIVPKKWLTVYYLNPMAGVIESFRTAMFGGAFNMFALTVSTVFALVLFFCAAWVFRRVEKNFADVI